MGSPVDEPLRFKCCYLDTNRMIFAPRPVTFSILREQIRDLFQIEPSIYIGNNGSKVAIQSQQDLDRVVHSELSNELDTGKKFSVKLHILDEHPLVNPTTPHSPSTTEGGGGGDVGVGGGGTVRGMPITVQKEASLRLGRRRTVEGLTVGSAPPPRPSSPPPGQEFRRPPPGHRRTNSGSMYRDGGGIFVAEPDGPGKPSSYHGSVRSLSSRSSSQSTTSASTLFWRGKQDDDRESGYSEPLPPANATISGTTASPNAYRGRAGTFPRTHNGDGNGDPLENEHGTFGNTPRRYTQDFHPFPQQKQQQQQQQQQQQPTPPQHHNHYAGPLPIRTNSATARLNQEDKDDGIVIPAEERKTWKRGKLLGSGAFGQVYLALDNITGEEFAVKQVDIHTELGAENLKEIQSLEQEISLLKNLRHERIVTYYGTERTSEYLAIFMEYVPGRSIHTRLREYGAFREEVVSKYTRQVLEGLMYLHSNRIIHRDIKGANVLADASGNIKLADFGASKRLQSVKTLMGFKSVHGTPYWMSPEAITTGASVGRETDIWSTGALVIEMSTTKPPFADHEPMAALFKIGQAETDFNQIIPQDVSELCRAFLMLTFKKNPKDRPSAKSLLSHPFVRI